MVKILKYILCIIILLHTLSVGAAIADNHRLYKQLDEAIANFPHYVKTKETKLANLRKVYAMAKTTDEKYDAACDLAANFDSYCSDSVLHYLRKARVHAMEARRYDRANFCDEQMVMLLIGSNAYLEAYKLLGQIDRRGLKTGSDLHGYYEARYRCCLAFSQNAIDEQTRKEYFAKANAALDSTIMYMTDEQERFLYKLQKAIQKGELNEAQRLLNQWKTTAKPGDREYAYVAYYQGMFYERFGKAEDVEYWLLHSAISDVKNAVTDQASLLKLVQILQKRGDAERAYRYIHFTWECSQKYNSRQRSHNLIPILTTVDSANQMQLRDTNRSLRLVTTLLGVLFLTVLSLAYFLNTQRKKLALARSSLKESYEKLSMLNRQLQKSNEEQEVKNQQLQALNLQMKRTNEKLFESNRLKEEYIGQFLNICSQYVDKLDDYGKTVNRYLKEGRQQELFVLSRSSDLRDRELNALFAKFDSIFLFLFPTFVEEYNALLKPEARVQLKEKGRLNSELRIFALMRLGISDLKQIANFMHFSISTIYNYRVKVRANAIGNKENFEKDIQNIGISKDF